MKDSSIVIESIKYDRSLHRRWLENTLLDVGIDTLIGANDRTFVEEPGRPKWRTTEPAIFYFDRRYWFNIITLLKDNDFYFYCNLSSPFTYTHPIVQYIDFDIDVIVHSDFTYDIVDIDEYEMNKQRFSYPPTVQHSISRDLQRLQTWINNRKDPFNESFVNQWYELYQNREN